MRVLFLGTGAGGGVPQWNCNCPYCRRARTDPTGRWSRREAALAVSADGEAWVLLDAPPDLREMMARYPVLFPRQGLRDTPVRAVVLTHGDVNHCLGLLTFRGPITQKQAYVSVYATAWLREVLLGRNEVFGQVKARWQDLPVGRWTAVAGPDDRETGLEVRALPVPGKPPTYHWEDHPENTVAVQVRPAGGGPVLTYAPVVREIPPVLQEAFQASAAVVLDGTFWTDDELLATDPYGRRASEIGHLPVQASLPLLAAWTVPYRIYTHINNTNPLNDPDSDAYRQVVRAGLRVAADGLELTL